MQNLPVEVELRVATLKETYQEVHVMVGPDLNGSDLFILTRPITLGEHMQLIDLVGRNEEAAFEFVFTNVVKGSYLANGQVLHSGDLPAGYTREIFEFVQDTSKFANPDCLAEGLNEWRYALNFVFPAAQALIMKAFPQYKMEDVEALTHNQLCKLIVLAEYSVGVPFDITPPKSEEEGQKKVVSGIMKEAECNDKYIDFGAENASLQDM